MYKFLSVNCITIIKIIIEYLYRINLPTKFLLNYISLLFFFSDVTLPIEVGYGHIWTYRGGVKSGACISD